MASSYMHLGFALSEALGNELVSWQKGRSAKIQDLARLSSLTCLHVVQTSVLSVLQFSAPEIGLQAARLTHTFVSTNHDQADWLGLCI